MRVDKYAAVKPLGKFDCCTGEWPKGHYDKYQLVSLWEFSPLASRTISSFTIKDPSGTSSWNPDMFGYWQTNFDVVTVNRNPLEGVVDFASYA